MSSFESKIFINKDYNPIIASIIFKRFWWMVVAVIAFFLSIAFFYLRYTKPVYESSTLIQLTEKNNGKELLQLETMEPKNDISSEIELLRSQFLFEVAVAKMNMNVSLFSKGKVLTAEKYHQSAFNVIPYELSDSSLCDIPIWIETAGKKVRLTYTLQNKKYEKLIEPNKVEQTKHFKIMFTVQSWEVLQNDDEINELYFTFNNPKVLAYRLASGLEVNPVDINAKTIEIKYSGTNPLMCRDIVQSVISTFFNYDEEVKRKSDVNILQFIQVQLDSIASELQGSKDSLTNYQRKARITDPELASKDLSENIDHFQSELFELESELATLHLVSSKLNADPNRLEIYRLIPEMLGKSYENSMVKQITDLNVLLERKEELLINVNENNTELKSLNQRIQSKIQSIRRSINVIEERINTQLRSIRTKIGGYEGEFLQLPEKKMEYNRLKSLQDLNEKYYSLLTEKKIMYSISKAGYTSTNRILNEPSISEIPVSPNTKMVYASFGFLGFVLGFVFLFIKYITFNEVNTVEDLKQILPNKVTILGNVPLLKGAHEFSQLVINDNPKSSVAEAFRNIRTNLSFVNANTRLIAISSSISGEGKTFVALNLAGIIALSGKKVVILDLDLRKPKVHLGLNVANTHGMSNLIVGQTTLDECVRKSAIENLDFISAGPIPPNPSELILSSNFQTILEELKQRYDIVVIDNPPVGLVADGVQILSKADVPIYIFKAHYSKRIFANRINDLFEMNQIEHLNVVLNGTKNFKGKYGYGYGYGYGYYEESNKKSKK